MKRIHEKLRVLKRRLKPVPTQLVRSLAESLENNTYGLPRIIHVETKTKCNGKCNFCAASVGQDTRPDITMSDALLDKIINELSTLKYSNRLSFYSNNEPFLDKRIFDIIAKARKAVPSAYLELKSNGTALNYEKVCRIFESGLDMLYINDYRSEGPNGELSTHKNIIAIKEELAKSRRFKGHYENGTYFTRVLISDRKETEVLGNRAGTSPNGMHLSQAMMKPCLRPFEMLTIDPTGKIGLCSEDLNFSEVMGNLTDSTIWEIWNSPAYNKVRKELLSGNRKIKSTCEKCDYKGFTHEIVSELSHSSQYSPFKHASQHPSLAPQNV